MEKLRECPFCGGIGDDPMKYMETDTKKRYVIDCYNCGLRMWSLTEDDVVKTWNNRQEIRRDMLRRDDGI